MSKADVSETVREVLEHQDLLQDAVVTFADRLLVNISLPVPRPEAPRVLATLSALREGASVTDPASQKFFLLTIRRAVDLFEEDQVAHVQKRMKEEGLTFAVPGTLGALTRFERETLESFLLYMIAKHFHERRTGVLQEAIERAYADPEDEG